MNEKIGCWNCKHLGWYESYFEEPADSGHTCEAKDVDSFKTFPCNRKLKCFEVQEGEQK